jgi:preprotein translocase subunit SecG
LLTYVLYGLYILSCVILVIFVLLQPGKADAGALFSSSISSTAFGPRGTQTLLAKITIGAAAAFMLIALALSMPALTESRSVLQSQPDTAPSPQATASPAAQQQQTGAPSESAATPAASPASSLQTAASPSPTPEQK